MSVWEELEAPSGYRGGARAKRAADTSRPAPSPPWGVGKDGRAQRLRATTGAAQAVVKVIGYRGGRRAAARAISYLARDRDPLEGRDGLKLVDAPDRGDLLDAWELHGSGEAAERRRDVMHLAISFPIGTDGTTALAVARSALPQMVGDRDWVISLHHDTAHPHVHALVRMRDSDGRSLRTNRAVLRDWREIVAARGRERGLALEASPRWARGRGLKGERRWERAMAARGEVPRTHCAAAREVAESLARGAPAETAFEALMTATAAPERGALEGLAWALLGEARAVEGDRRAHLLGFTRQVGEAARDLPEPHSQRALMAAIWQARRQRTDHPDPDEIARAFAELRGKGRERARARTSEDRPASAQERDPAEAPRRADDRASPSSPDRNRSSSEPPHTAGPRQRGRDGDRDPDRD